MTLARRRVWAQQQFGVAQLGDARRTRRLVKLATQMAANSSGSIPQQTGNTADMKAAYRLFAAEDVTHAAILQPHLEPARARAGPVAQVFLVQDTAELSFTNQVHCEGLGPIGPSRALQGLQQQNVLAIDPQTQRPLGLMYQRHHRRQSRPPGHSNDRTATRKVPLEERESHWWVEAIRTIGSPPAGVRWIHVGDRGEDIFGVYQEAQRQGTDWLIRAARDRRVQTPTGETHRMSYARHRPSIATRRLNVRTPSGGTRPALTLTLADFWRGIGRLGGHLARKRDGPLGWLRAWRGWQSFQLILLGAELYGDRDASNCG